MKVWVVVKFFDHAGFSEPAGIYSTEKRAAEVAGKLAAKITMPNYESIAVMDYTLDDEYEITPEFPDGAPETEIEVTPKMIAAGLAAVWPEPGPPAYVGDMVARIYRQMEVARQGAK